MTMKLLIEPSEHIYVQAVMPCLRIMCSPPGAFVQIRIMLTSHLLANPLGMGLGGTVDSPLGSTLAIGCEVAYPYTLGPSTNPSGSGWV